MKFPAIPKTPKQARQRSVRKLKAIRKQTMAQAYDIASYWDEGIVSGSIDGMIDDLDMHIERILEAIDEQMASDAEHEAAGPLI